MLHPASPCTEPRHSTPRPAGAHLQRSHTPSPAQVANVGPADWNFDETMSTLRYANRAKNIQNKPRVNEDPKDAMLREFQAEIVRLREGRPGGGVGVVVLWGGAVRWGCDAVVL